MESPEKRNTQSSNSGIPRSPREVPKQATTGESDNAEVQQAGPALQALPLGLVHQMLTGQTPSLPTHNGCFSLFLHRDSVVVDQQTFPCESVHTGLNETFGQSLFLDKMVHRIWH